MMMKKNLSQRKGVSLMVGYVLLIALAIGLSVGVFFYLKLYLPPEDPKCPENVDISIDDVVCSISGSGGANVNIKLTNRGLFTIDSAYIKIGDADRIYKVQLNDVNLRLVSSGTICGNSEIGLEPGEKYCETHVYLTQSPLNSVLQEISVEPLIFVENTPVICSNDVVKRNVVCT
jgi:hypothetical protein